MNTLAEIVTATSIATGIPIEDINGFRRVREFAYARFMVTLILSESRPTWTATRLAREFTECDHSTILHRASRARFLLSVDAEFQEQYQKAKSHLQKPCPVN